MTDFHANSAARSPLLSPQDFATAVRALVLDTAPSRFAIVSEYETEDGEPDACVAGWGLAGEGGGVTVVDAGGRRFVSAQSAERAAFLFSRFTGGPVRLEWIDRQREKTDGQE